MNYSKANFTTKSFCLYLFGSYFTVTYGSTRSTHCKTRKGWYSSNSAFLTESAMDKYQCILQCISYAECVAVQFSDGNKTCTYYKWDKLWLKEEAMAPGVTFVRPLKVVVVFGEYSFSTAGDVCVSFGGKLTDYADLQSAWESGYSFCRCAWIYNGHSYYPFAQYGVPGCEYGITQCSQPSADVFCSL